jgi:DNA-binding CsgD family transcriptional regulator
MSKSHRNRKTCMAPELSAGDKVLISSNCPSEMTERVKTVISKEIESFDPAVALHEADISAAGGPNRNAYHDWIEQNEGQEPPEANPDIVAEGGGINYTTSTKDDEMVSLLTEFRQSLSARELQVWNLVMVHQMSHRQVENLLNIQRRLVSVYLKRAKKKFIKFMEAEKHEREH